MSAPLDGVFVLDLSTLVPGPLATLMLAEAGAEVVKIERPGRGEDMRHYEPKRSGESLGFALLNRGKKSIELDLKSPGAIAVLKPLIERSDILVEQFRPGVMDRLGLGYDILRKINPRLIYCSLTAHGQTGPDRERAGHDLNFIARSGLLSVSTGPDDRPTVPPGLIGDVGGGSYPAVMNILLALMRRQQTGEGIHLDIAMSEAHLPFACWAFAEAVGRGAGVENGDHLLTGATPRYRLYRAANGRLIAVAAIEQKFWEAFCELIGLDPALRDDSVDPEATIEAVAERLAGRPSDEWEIRFATTDCCCNVVRRMDEVRDDPQFEARGLFKGQIAGADGATIPALPLPLAPEFRTDDQEPKGAPALGAHNSELKKES